MARHFGTADLAIRDAIGNLKYYGAEVDPGRWQGVSTECHPDLVTKELIDLDIAFPIPHTLTEATEQIEPNLPWAERHFLERVGRVPTNPGEEYKNWPWWKGQDEVTMSPDSHDGKHFTHTYQERFWPKRAGDLNRIPGQEIYGIRYSYGDLDDVIALLRRDPQTRQAYFPIFFPEDTGAVHGGRIPCTLGYHLLLRGGLLHCWYDIRSCDAVRHFRDDLYLAVRLVQWVVAELVEKELRDDREQIWVDVNPGTLFFKAHSFHVHKGDMHLL